MQYYIFTESMLKDIPDVYREWIRINSEPIDGLFSGYYKMEKLTLNV